MRILQGQTMGSPWLVTIADEVSDLQAERIQGGIELVLDMVNQKMSTYITNSEIEQFGRHKDGTVFPVSPEMRIVVHKALQICAQTDGMYDITVAPLVNIWGFGPTEISNYPDDDAVEHAMALVDYRKVKLVDEGLIKEHPDIKLDLCSIAKGFAVDKLAALLENFGYQNYLAEIGGESRISGHKYGEHWRIGIERPQWGGGTHEYMLTFKDVRLAVATSGNYKNYSHQEGQLATHEIDVKTGHYKSSNLLSVTVFANDCMSADGYATALFIMGDDAFVFSEREKIPALFIYPDQHELEKCCVKVNTALSQYLNNKIHL